MLTALWCVVVYCAVFSIWLSMASMPLVIAYPLAKRYLSTPQFVLGLAFNWGALVGWGAVHGSLYLPAVLPLYAAGVCWTMVYDTIYAHQVLFSVIVRVLICSVLLKKDKHDDAALGLNSSALFFGERNPQWLAGFSAATVALLALAGSGADMGAPFYLISVLGGGAHLAWQLKSIDYNSAKSCGRMFVSNKWFGALVLAGIVVDRALAANSDEPSKAILAKPKAK